MMAHGIGGGRVSVGEIAAVPEAVGAGCVEVGEDSGV
jgi:hypothetical protein